jgi:hypothetical protein
VGFSVITLQSAAIHWLQLGSFGFTGVALPFRRLVQ